MFQRNLLPYLYLRRFLRKSFNSERSFRRFEENCCRHIREAIGAFEQRIHSKKACLHTTFFTFVSACLLLKYGCNTHQTAYIYSDWQCIPQNNLSYVRFCYYLYEILQRFLLLEISRNGFSTERQTVEEYY